MHAIQPLYAKVIVDVPAQQTDRPFDYAIPEQFATIIEIGSRVIVPFGPRKLQGFVVDVTKTREVKDDVVLRQVIDVLDIVPPLTNELIQLSAWMSEKYVCPRIISLQAMLPSALKVKYERLLHTSVQSPHDWAEFDLTSRSLFNYIREHEPLAKDQLVQQFPDAYSMVKDWIKVGIVVEQQKVSDRVTIKKVQQVIPHPELVKQEAKWPRAAKRQLEILQFFAEHPEPIVMSDLMRLLNVASTSIKSLADKGWVRIEQTVIDRDPYADRKFQPTVALPLTKEQETVYTEISRAIDADMAQTFLLHGVTGSGKTEVYLQSIQYCLNRKEQAIVLVPEISLTPQMVDSFKRRFGERVAVLHSRLSQGERYDEWRKISTGRAEVVVGARSAIFAPFTKLGLIIIDEEHETSYKQEESPKYHAKEVAMARAKHHNAVVILGSATPSLESFAQSTLQNNIKRLTMQSRVHGRPLPQVHVIDMRQQLKDGNRSMFSRPLHAAIKARLERKEQTVLLLNRRGYATFIMCRSCGFVAQCPHCEISLTYHRSMNRLRCHYCGYTEKEPAECPSCESEHIRHFGTGTQRVEEQLHQLFPGVRVIRMDVDTTTRKGSHERLLTQFRNQEADILLGTQMVAKGLDFPFVTLVGVIAADTVLNLPDFRAAEKTFQLLTQVAGRAGRHELAGEVYIQTYTPEHYSIMYASGHNYEQFVQRELQVRKLLHYPPYSKLILITFSHEQVQNLWQAGESFSSKLKQFHEQSRSVISMDVLGPVSSPIPKLKDRFRFQCMVKYRGEPVVIEWVWQVVTQLQTQFKRSGLTISVDVDPQSMM